MKPNKGLIVGIVAAGLATVNTIVFTTTKPEKSYEESERRKKRRI